MRLSRKMLGSIMKNAPTLSPLKSSRIPISWKGWYMVQRMDSWWSEIYHLWILWRGLTFQPQILFSLYSPSSFRRTEDSFWLDAAKVALPSSLSPSHSKTKTILKLRERANWQQSATSQIRPPFLNRTLAISLRANSKDHKLRIKMPLARTVAEVKPRPRCNNQTSRARYLIKVSLLTVKKNMIEATRNRVVLKCDWLIIKWVKCLLRELVKFK